MLFRLEPGESLAAACVLTRRVDGNPRHLKNAGVLGFVLFLRNEGVAKLRSAELQAAHFRVEL